MVHAPLLAAGPETVLTAVWARRADAAHALAARHGAEPAASVDELFDRCDVVAFAVPPDVQAELASRAAAAGRALLLEKPIAGDLAAAESLVAAVERAGVASLVVLSWRYSDAVRAFLADAGGFRALGATGRFLGGGLVRGPFQTPWRLDRGPLVDLGPHVIDLLDAALGTVVGVRATGDLRRFVGLQLDHGSGVSSSVVLSGHTPVDPSRAGVELYGPTGVLEVDCTSAVSEASFATLRRELAEVVAGAPHPLDVRRGLHLQRWLHEAEQQLLPAR
jgi:predicted dehydrogenase